MAGTHVELREVTRDNVGRVVRLAVHPEQARFVATNSNSLAEAYVTQDRAWPRAIYMADEPVGFLMLDLTGPDHPEATDGRASYFLWRFMIAAEHQGKGYGRAAIDAVIQHVKTLPGAAYLDTSYVPGEGCPGPFYEKLGFKPTGEVDEGEVILRLSLA